MKRRWSVYVKTDDGKSLTFNDIVANGEQSAILKADAIFHEGEPFYRGTLHIHTRRQENVAL